MSAPSPIIEFANILKSNGVGSVEAEGFKQSRSADRVFLERAAVLEQLFKSQDRILTALHAASDDPPSRQGSANTGVSQGRAIAG